MFAATAALTGAAMLALISDMASRSGSSSPPSAANSSSVRPLVFSLISSSLDALVQIVLLDRVGVCRGVVRQDVGGHRRIHRNGDVGVDERHGFTVGELFARLRRQLFVSEALLAIRHVSSSLRLIRVFPFELAWKHEIMSADGTPERQPLAIAKLLRDDVDGIVDAWRELCHWDPMLPPHSTPPIAAALVSALADAIEHPQPLGWGPDPEMEKVVGAFTLSAGSLDVAIGELVCLGESLRRRLFERRSEE